MCYKWNVPKILNHQNLKDLIQMITPCLTCRRQVWRGPSCRGARRSWRWPSWSRGSGCSAPAACTPRGPPGCPWTLWLCARQSFTFDKYLFFLSISLYTLSEITEENRINIVLKLISSTIIFQELSALFVSQLEAFFIQNSRLNMTHLT